MQSLRCSARGLHGPRLSACASCLPRPVPRLKLSSVTSFSHHSISSRAKSIAVRASEVWKTIFDPHVGCMHHALSMPAAVLSPCRRPHHLLNDHLPNRNLLVHLRRSSAEFKRRRSSRVCAARHPPASPSCSDQGEQACATKHQQLAESLRHHMCSYFSCSTPSPWEPPFTLTQEHRQDLPHAGVHE